MNKSDLKLLNLFILCIVTLGIFSAVLSAVEKIHIVWIKKTEIITPPALERLTYIPQFVLLSFDGSKDVGIWRNIRNFEREMNATGTPLHVTYFINAAYFLTKDKKDLYHAPRQTRGESNIGFSEGIENLQARIIEVNNAIADGDEIASHTVGHYWGSSWSKEEWIQEFKSFDDILFGLEKNYQGEHFPRLNLTAGDIMGFRAPALSISPNLYTALAEHRATYDSSEIGPSGAWPKKDVHGIWHIPLGTIRLDHDGSSMVAMDYSIREHKMGHRGNLVKNSPEWNAQYADILHAYLNYFENNYSGNRAPVVIGHHFEDWDDNLYWEVMKDFARAVCSRPEARCTTYREYVKYLEEYGIK